MSSADSIGNQEEPHGSNTSTQIIETCSGPESVAADKNPRNLKELLNMCIQVQAVSTISESEQEQKKETMPMDDEKLTWLNTMLSSLSVSRSTELKRMIELISQPIDTLNDIERVENALDEILNQVDDIDVGNAFFQMGGFNALVSLLNNRICADIRALAAGTIAVVCSNNRRGQMMAVKDEAFTPLMELAFYDNNLLVQFKSLSAITAIISNNILGATNFRKHDGYKKLNVALHSDSEKIQTKICYLIMALCDADPSSKGTFLEMGMVEILICLARLANSRMTEQFLDALNSLTRHHNEAKQEMMKNDYELWDFLGKTILTKQDDECMEFTVEISRKLLRRMNRVKCTPGGVKVPLQYQGQDLDPSPPDYDSSEDESDKWSPQGEEYEYSEYPDNLEDIEQEIRNEMMKFQSECC